jgi:hypothetical protein
MIKSSDAPSERTRVKRLHERGRWDSLRPINKQELKATKVLSMPIDEASAKIRTGRPVADEEEYALPIWAGVVPLELSAQPAQPDPRNLPDLELPDHVGTVKLG